MHLWGIKDAAEYLNMHRETLRLKSVAKLVPAIRLHSRWKYRKEVLDEWLAQGCPSQTEQPTLFD